ncbi:hypothetical protein NC652_021538 [Populus alba x Populus x berolinensis]|nr:hypothetical protein NC652_021538 [Populus alba x Populus x berolinensis]
MGKTTALRIRSGLLILDEKGGNKQGKGFEGDAVTPSSCWPTNSLLFTPHSILDAENKKWATEDLSLWYRDSGIMDQSFVANRKQLSIFC